VASISRFQFLGCGLIAALVWAQTVAAAPLEPIAGVPPQPLLMQAQRVAAALETAGSPLHPEDAEALAALAHHPHDEALARAVQDLLDSYCLAVVHINPEGRVKAARGPAEARLVQGGWTSFLVKVANESGSQAALGVTSPQADAPLFASSGQPNPKPDNLLSPGQVANRFLELQLYRQSPMTETLSGGVLDYSIVQLYTNATGPREVQLAFNAGPGTSDLGFRNEVPILFECTPSASLIFHVRDVDGSPTTASFIIRDRVDRRATGRQRANRAEAQLWEPDPHASRFRGIYPLPARRVAMTDEYPDLYFQRQVYRGDGERVVLPPGTYDILFGRGPEYLWQTRTVQIDQGALEHHEHFALKRWIHLAALGWYSGDHHVHAGGCAHYESPEAGVTPEVMFRQGLGEDLNVSCVLTWGPCWYHQKSFFEGATHSLSRTPYLMRYDVEVSGFPSSHAGHICLLRLQEDDYPGTTTIEEWPSWTLPVLQWARAQGGVVGYAHSGWGLEPQVPTSAVPNYVIPKFDGIGANEYIVTAAHGEVDFFSMVDTPAPWELNMWYHTLNTGLRVRASGETDFPCIYDERVGMGRSYARMEGELTFDAFAQKLKEGANYVSDGKSHILDFHVNEVEMGRGDSELRLDDPQSVRITAKIAAYLPETQDETGAHIARLAADVPPYWDIERARIGTSREVKVELIVNGFPVDETILAADGATRDISFEYEIPYSSWVALRVYQSSHTNPIFVLVDDKPIRASRRSAEWCMQSVDHCWNMKRAAIRLEERPAAEAAYARARDWYAAALAEASAE
jgi:hypothetical protein